MSEPATASKPLTAYLRGVGLWAPGFSSFAEWVTASRETGVAPSLVLAEGQAGGRPAAELLHPRLRRRTSVLTRASVTALEAAVREGGADLASVRFVLVSSFGEIETTVELLAQLADPQGPVSPTKFHNSVHNTATGYMSIASGNHREATALAGGPHNLEIAMLSLFRVVTLEDWTDLMYINMYGCDRYGYGPDSVVLCTAPSANPLLAAAYFVSFVLTGTMIILNLFIGVIMSGMEEAQAEAAEALRMANPETAPTPASEVEALQRELEAMQARLGSLAHMLNKPRE